MAKAKKPQKSKKAYQSPSSRKQKQSFSISERTQDVFFCVLIILIMLVLMKPMVIDGLSPQGVDVVSSIGQQNQVREYKEESGERALWNPYIFGGMPTYQRHYPITFSVDTILNMLARIFNGVFIFYIFGGLGAYLLFRYLKMNPLMSFLGSMAFILYPHYKSLYLEGHFTKFRALMLLPWVFVSFSYFLNKRNLLAMALFALAFGIQIRTQHYQIVFYSGLMVFAIGVYPFIRDLIDRKFTLFFKSTAMLLVALGLSLTMAAQPLFLAREYLPYSKRGKTTVDLSNPEKVQKQTERSDGVTMEYATRWSTHPAEMLTWLVPRFYGGMSRETYQGDRYPNLQGREIPGYWGHMPFTQSYEYMGALLLFLAFLGLYAFWRDRRIKAVALFALFLILLSFGRHFESFYALFFNYFPFFNKFRAPMMSVTITFFMITILAVYGLRYLHQLKRGESWSAYKPVLITGGGLVGLCLLLLLFSSTFSFAKVGENFNPQVSEMVHNIRQDFFTADVLRSLGILIVGILAVLAYLKKKLPFTAMGLILIIVVTADLIHIQHRVHKDYIDRDRLERNYFQATPTDRFLNQDDGIYRILPGGQQFGKNRWAYYHQTIGGYSPIKMYTIEELIQNNLSRQLVPGFPYNPNILKILNVKYLVLQQQLNHRLIEPVYKDSQYQLFTYRFNEFMPRGFFVGDYRVIENEYARLRALNAPNFDPEQEAILERELESDISTPDSSSSSIREFTPNEITFDVYTDKSALFVISELYYPPGWKIFIDDQEVDHIYKTDHAIQSVVVPAGAHEVQMRFHPDSYYQNVRIARASLTIIYLTIVASLIVQYRTRIREWLQKVKA